MWQHWMRYIRNFFGFTRGEALGFSLLAAILLLVYTGWFVYSMLPAAPYEPIADQQKLDSLVRLLEAADTLRPVYTPALAGGTEAAPVQEFFPFDPNTLPYDSLLRLGFTPALARRLENYRLKGGRFRKKEDLQKLYGLPQELYLSLEPWMRMPEQPAPQRTDRGRPAPGEEKRNPPASTTKFDLNSADSLQLIAIRGIGPVLSSRIIKFREALGGFVAAEQLGEVWGLPPEAAEALLERAFIAADATPRLLEINTADASQLARHPYISPKQARLIVAYRTQHGPYRQPEDLLNIHTLEENFVKKLTPYLHF